MISHFGDRLKLSVFGSSHGPEIGMTLEGIPAGLAVDLQRLQGFLDRRAPGRTAWSSPRKETDVPHFQNGLTGGHTDGNTIRAVIYNENVQKADYHGLQHIPRPGHADFTAWMKYGPDFDMSGGGPFSGRMTAPLCVAGGMCMQWLEEKGIRIGAHIARIGDIEDNRFDPVSPDLDAVQKDFPVLCPVCGQQMQATVSEAQKAGDSLGGIIECAVTGLPAGIGGPMFGGVESKLSCALYGIPAVKGVDFGLGFSGTHQPGSKANDAFTPENGRIRTQTNNCGGILGGITTGMPVLFRVAIKPTPSIAKPQKSIDLKTMEEVTIKIQGRHDPCIVPRAVPVVEAAAAIAIYDLILGETQWI